MWKQCRCHPSQRSQGWFITREIVELLSSRLEEFCVDLKSTEKEEWLGMLCEFFEETGAKRLSVCHQCLEQGSVTPKPLHTQDNVVYLKKQPNSQAV